MKKKEEKSFATSKEDFIEFLSKATPEDLNRYIAEKGKPRKLIIPMIFFDDDSLS